MRWSLPTLIAQVLHASQPKLRLGDRGPWHLFPVHLDLNDFHTHLYCVGQSGQGKSKLLQHLLFELTLTNWGCGLLDPHADLASDLLAQLASYPTQRPWLSDPLNRQRLIYLDPARTDYLVPFNLLKNATSTPYEIAENIVEAFRRVWPETLAEAPRFAQIMRNALVVLAIRGLSLLELEPLLTDVALRRQLLVNFPDPQVVSFFDQQYNRWGREQAIFASPVLNKVSAFLFQPQVRAMLGAQENHLNFRHILDHGKLLIVNLGGFNDEETQRLLGSLLVTSLEQAAFSRRQQAPEARRPFFCMIDEFPLFCSRDQTSLARILSECRKFRLQLGISHQTITQLPGERIQGALENAQLKVIFGTGRQTAQAIVGDLFLPNPKAVKHEVTNAAAQARSHPLYQVLPEQFEIFTQTIQRLPHRQVLVKLPGSDQVHSLRTPTTPKSRINRTQLASLQTALARQVGQPRQVLEQQIAARHNRARPGGHAAVPPASDDEFWVEMQ